MKKISVLILLFTLSSFLFSYYHCNYFLINEEELTEKQLKEIIKLNTEYQPKFHELKKKINQKVIDESIQLIKN